MTYIPDMTERFPEGMNGVDMTPSCFGEPVGWSRALKPDDDDDIPVEIEALMTVKDLQVKLKQVNKAKLVNSFIDDRPVSLNDLIHIKRAIKEYITWTNIYTLENGRYRLIVDTVLYNKGYFRCLEDYCYGINLLLKYTSLPKCVAKPFTRWEDEIAQILFCLKAIKCNKGVFPYEHNEQIKDDLPWV